MSEGNLLSERRGAPLREDQDVRGGRENSGNRHRRNGGNRGKTADRAGTRYRPAYRSSDTAGIFPYGRPAVCRSGPDEDGNASDDGFR